MEKFTFYANQESKDVAVGVPLFFNHCKIDRVIDENA
jgi:hypothetical protein